MQGVGQALWEQIVYDRDTAQLLTGSFMDYAMPRADLCRSSTPNCPRCRARRTRSGMRPAGEGGTTPALGVVINAIVDALAEFGVTHVEMPATPERVWRDGFITAPRSACHCEERSERSNPEPTIRYFEIASLRSQ